jgi:hypothetical protein
MSPDPAAIVRSVLQEYANRGVFRAFREVDTRNGRTEFEILCFPFTEQPFSLVYTDEPRSLTFKRLLGDMPARSAMYRRFKSFMKDRSSPELPAHRRVDSSRAALTWSNRLGNVNVSLHIQEKQHEYATRKAINLLSDIFLDLLTESPFYEYMSEHFEMPED